MNHVSIFSFSNEKFIKFGGLIKNRQNRLKELSHQIQVRVLLFSKILPPSKYALETGGRGRVNKAPTLLEEIEIHPEDLAAI